jgi:import inner membrane translocase subunit TIM8
MGWFGGNPESSSSGDTIDMSKYNTGEYGSKLRSSSSYSSGEFDSSPDTGGSFSGHSSSISSGSANSGEELQQAVALEQQKLQFMQQMHKVNDVCWDMCIGSPSSSLSGREQTCVSNCVERFVDTSVLLVNRFAQLAQRMGAGR